MAIYTSGFSHVVEVGLLGRYLVITPKKSNSKITRNFYLSKSPGHN